MGLFRKQSHNSSAFWLDGVTPPLIQWKQSRCLSAPRLLCFISLLCSCGKDDRFPAVLLQLLRRSPLMIASPHWQWMATGMLIMGPKGGSQGPRHLLLTSFFIHLSGRKLLAFGLRVRHQVRGLLVLYFHVIKLWQNFFFKYIPWLVWAVTDTL